MDKTIVTIVLDISYQPYSLLNPQKAFLLAYQKRCNIVDYFPEDVYSLSTVRDIYLVPSIIQVNTLKKFTKLKVPSRIAIFYRDYFTCAYCGRYCPNPTIDHIIPKSKGGDWTWENLVTCCPDCNQKKGNNIWKPKYVKPIQPLAFDIQIRKIEKKLHPYVKNLIKNYLKGGIKNV